MTERLHDPPGCWCPDERTMGQMRYAGHTEECSSAREAWRRNYAHLSRLAREKAEMESIGRALVESRSP